MRNGFQIHTTRHASVGIFYVKIYFHDLYTLSKARSNDFLFASAILNN